MLFPVTLGLAATRRTGVRSLRARTVARSHNITATTQLDSVASDDPPQVISKKGFADKAEPVRVTRRSGHENDFQSRSNGGGTLSQLVPGHVRHVHVGDEHLGAKLAVVELGESFGSIESGLDLASEVFKP